MKKLISSIFAVLILVSSCNQEQDLSPVNNFEKEISFLTEMNKSGLNLTVSNLGKNITPIGNNEITLNQRQLVKGMLSGLNGQYFNADEKTIMDFSSNYGELRLPDHFANARKNGTVDLSTFEIYSEDQLALVQPFVDDLLNEEDLNATKSKAISFQQSVVSSTLSDDEKIQLLTLSTGVISFAEFVEDGGIDLIANELDIIYSSNGRVQGCSVSSRNVLASAVVGLAGGAATGGYVGATAGTFTVPILGTAVGGVGGAVFGGAAGFVSGLISGVAAELLTSCGR
ncbi:MAG: hypothetical protein KatS3mg032_0781 [Cyclobacteriaceae bacterium]|nr:MAG: hypothetical protein KatS3mg032_0781 [Cyclobacteriaceae bacterium]